MSTSNSGKVEFAVVQDMRQCLIIMPTPSPSLVTVLESADTIERHTAQSCTVNEAPLCKRMKSLFCVKWLGGIAALVT
jgi:hypothetical protein